MKTKCVIVGGGAAGLSAAIRLSELGHPPVVIEGGTYPSHKVCGEFLSPECLPILKAWDIHPVPITQAVFRTPQRELLFPFPSPAGGLSHVELDPLLAARAKRCGADIRTNTKVESIHPKSTSSHEVVLSTGEVVEAEALIVATGRIPSYSVQAITPSYLGFKAHFEIPATEKQLEMFSFPGGYVGVSPIENGKNNVAGLIDIAYANDHLQLIEKLISQHPSLSRGRNLFGTWMTASIPAFGMRTTPGWSDALFIGDAAMTLPPACGNGLATAILGGCAAAEHVVDGRYRAFSLMWTKRCRSQMFWAKLLHHVMLSPRTGNLAMRLVEWFPFLGKKLFALTRSPGH